MARNSRKKRLKKQDFQKVKLKVGKKLQPAQNATDTSFKSMSIFVPTQLNESSQPTNQRNQTLKVRNYKLVSSLPEMRREAKGDVQLEKLAVI